MRRRTGLKSALAGGSVRAAALLTAVMGLVNLVSATLPALHERVILLRPVLPLEVRYGSHLATALAGFALLMLAQSLWRRKRAAWLLCIAALLVSATSHLLKGLDWEEATLAVVLAGWLVSLRSQFWARSDAPTMRQGVRTLAVSFLFTLAYGVAGFYLLDRHFRVDFGLRDAVLQTVAMFTEFSDPGLEPVTHHGRWFASSLYVVAAGTGGFALIALLRPVLHRERATASDRARARAIVEAHGRSSLARFLLFDDKSYWFSEGGSVIGFAVSGRVCVALGDPVGPREDARAAIRGFRAFCAVRDWSPAFYQTLPDYLDDYRAAGFETLCVGAEAVVDVHAFTLAGGANKSLRGGVGRLQKAGYETELSVPPHPAAVMAELSAVSEEWLRAQKGREKRFSLGWFDEAYLQDGPVMAVRTPDGAICAFANIIPEYQIRETTIDLMRRDSSAPNGVMDLLFVALIEWARGERGDGLDEAARFATFNLGLSPLAGVGKNIRDPAAERAVGFIYQHVNQFYNFKGLFDYKNKFHPAWRPRYLAYDGPAGLLPAALAVIRADNA